MPKLFSRERPTVEHNGAPGEAEQAVRPAPVDARLLKASRAQPATPAAPAVVPPLDYAKLGEHVATVLEAAKEAAEKMRLEAYAEVQQLRKSMQEQAREALATAKATAERADAHVATVTADVERQSKDVREQADEYARSRREAADAEAAAVLARAEKQASVRERTFQERQRSLDQNVVRTEKRLRQLVVGLHELASGLAELVPRDDQDESDDSGSLPDLLTRSARESHSARRESERT